MTTIEFLPFSSNYHQSKDGSKTILYQTLAFVFLQPNNMKLFTTTHIQHMVAPLLSILACWVFPLHGLQKRYLN